jgi:hypothetical protein
MYWLACSLTVTAVNYNHKQGLYNVFNGATEDDIPA